MYNWSQEVCLQISHGHTYKVYMKYEYFLLLTIIMMVVMRSYEVTYNKFNVVETWPSVNYEQKRITNLYNY
jgi:hypothetical protein